jgi:hypothetical protein
MLRLSILDLFPVGFPVKIMFIRACHLISWWKRHVCHLLILFLIGLLISQKNDNQFYSLDFNSLTDFSSKFVLKFLGVKTDAAGKTNSWHQTYLICFVYPQAVAFNKDQTKLVKGTADKLKTWAIKLLVSSKSNNSRDIIFLWLRQHLLSTLISEK